MPTSYNLTGDLGDLLAAPSIAATARAWLETNLDGTDGLVDTTGQVVRLGGASVSVEPDGTFTATGLAGSDSTDLNVEAGTLQYQLVVEYRDPGTSGNYKRTWRSGWFFLDATSDIAALAKSVTPAVAATGAEIVAAAAAEADRAELAAEAAVAPTDTQVATLAQDPLSETGQALSAMIVAEVEPKADRQRDSLRTFRAALAGRNVDVLVIGDSISEGTGPTLIEKRWQSRFRDDLRARYSIAAGGRGYVPAIYGIATPPSDKLWTASGGAIDARILGHGLGRRNMRLNAAGHKMTLTVPAGHTDVDIFVSAISTETSWYKPWVDGVAGTNVNVQAVATPVRRDLVFNLASGLDPAVPHEVAVEWGVGNVWLSGAMLYKSDRTSGVRLWDGAHHGKTSSWFSDTTQPWWLTVNTIQPDLVVLAVGRNDWSTGVSVSTYKANVETIIAQVRTQTTNDPSIVLMPPYGTASTGTPAAPWGDFVDALHEVAAADPGEVSVLALPERMGTITDAASNALGITVADYTHPSDLGSQMMADALMDYVTRP